MKKPTAKTTRNIDPKATKSATTNAARTPKAFAPQKARPQNEDNFQHEKNQQLAPLKIADEFDGSNPLLTAKKSRIPGFLVKLILWAAGILFSLGLALMADRLIADLFARYIWLGWAGIGALAILILGILALTIREFFALKALNNLDDLRQSAKEVLETDLPKPGRAVLLRLNKLYQSRPDLARARQNLVKDSADLLDGAIMIESAERHLMAPLDERAKALTAAAARRVAIVTAISPRAIVDLAFVAYESLKLARNIASLYGARPGFFSSWRLAGAILSHLAVTGGVALGDSIIQQMLGHGLAAKLSARLGEGLVNGLMSVRVGIAAMKTTRPLPFDQLKQPKIMDFMGDLANITAGDKKE